MSLESGLLEVSVSVIPMFRLAISMLKTMLKKIGRSYIRTVSLPLQRKREGTSQKLGLFDVSVSR
jgi:hypothetical protein